MGTIHSATAAPVQTRHPTTSPVSTAAKVEVRGIELTAEQRAFLGHNGAKVEAAQVAAEKPVEGASPLTTVLESPLGLWVIAQVFEARFGNRKAVREVLDCFAALNPEVHTAIARSTLGVLRRIVEDDTRDVEAVKGLLKATGLDANNFSRC